MFEMCNGLARRAATTGGGASAHRSRLILAAAMIVGVSAPFAAAEQVLLRITAQSLAPANGVSFAPLRFGFGNGTFDAFDNGQAAFLLGQPDIASAPIVSVAEGGSGSTWFPAFMAAEPNADLGSVTGPSGPFTPGAINSADFLIDTSNRYFTFASMVVPSNDHFIGNDNPMQYEVFDANGNLILNAISQFRDQIWDAGSETENAANAAFLTVGTNSQRVDENGVVSFNFSDLSTFNGLTTAAGYDFDFSTLDPNQEIFRISFEVVPEPASAALLGLGGLALLARRRAVR